MELNEKEVIFARYCPKCKYRLTKENDDPCEECLTNPVGYGTRKPLKFEKGVRENGRKKLANNRQ